MRERAPFNDGRANSSAIGGRYFSLCDICLVLCQRIGRTSGMPTDVTRH